MSAPGDPSEQDWTVLFALAAIGENECPWGWSGSFTQFPSEWGSAEYEQAVRRCLLFLQARGITE